MTRAMCGTVPILRCPEFASTYLDGCRCDFCRADWTRRRKRSRLAAARRARGEFTDEDLIDAEQIRTALKDAVRAHGKVITEIAHASGLAPSSVKRIYYGETKRVRRKSAFAIWNAIAHVDDDVRPDSGNPNHLVPAKRPRQVIRSLAAQGWTYDHQIEILQKNLHIKGGFVTGLAQRSQKPWVRRKNAQAVEWLAKAIGNNTGPSLSTMRRMEKLGVFPLRHYNLKGDIIESTLSGEQLSRAKRSV